METPFSWSDKIHIAITSCSGCLPCLRTVPSNDSLQNHINSNDDGNFNSAINRIPRARPDELQGLLADASDTDVDAERLSLHSNPGRNRRKRRTKTKKITLFGYDLFGRNASPPIHLPDNDDALFHSSSSSQTPSTRRGRFANGLNTPGAVATANSIATFDSDAAPLDVSIIDELSSTNAAALAAAAAEAEAQRLKEKEERRRRRKERKEMKRLAEALKQQDVLPEDNNGEEFEGFQGSGSAVPPPSGKGFPRIPNAGNISPQLRAYRAGTRTTSDSGSGSAFSGREEFGRFVTAENGSFLPPGYSLPQPPPLAQGDEDDDAADLDGGLYAGKRRGPNPNARGSGGGSDSRSRTSTSLSFSDRQIPSLQAEQLSPLQPYPYPEPQLHPDSQEGDFVPKNKKKSSKKSSTTSRTTKSHSSNTSISQSPSLASPASAAIGAEQKVVSPSTVEQGLGFFDLEDDVPSPAAIQFDDGKESPLSPASKSELPTGGFPTTGFGGGPRKLRDMGAFLARRGDTEAGDRS